MKIKIMIIYGGTLKAGGMETYLINYFKKLQGNNFQIDFIVTGKEKGVYDNYIVNKGGNIFYVTPRRKNFLKNMKEMKKILSNGNYDIVHCHMDAANYYGLKAAFKCNVKVRISHSHNTNYLTNNKFKILNLEHVRKKIPQYATHLFACSEVAGKWLYGNEFDVKNENCYIIPNAIECDKFIFNEKIRNHIREELDISSFMIGHVGRFDTQKNHKYLAKIMKCVVEKNNNISFCLFGEGFLKQDIKNLITELKLDKNVIFMGNKDNMCDYYNAMDLFLLPSLFEGLPLTMVEAQASGLDCLVSNRITQEAKLTDNTTYIPVDESNINVWVKCILDEVRRKENRSKKSNKACHSIINCGYNLDNSALMLSSLYRQIFNEE